MRFTLFFLLTILAVAGEARASLDFTFSFTGDPSRGSEPGTVTGLIEGLSDNTTNGQAAHVIVESVPGGLGLDSLVGADFTSLITANFFTTSGGQIVGAEFVGFTPGSAALLAIVPGNLNDLSGTHQVLNAGPIGPTGVIFTATTTPEPTAMAVWGVGAAFLAFGAVIRRRNAKKLAMA